MRRTSGARNNRALEKICVLQIAKKVPQATASCVYHEVLFYTSGRPNLRRGRRAEPTDFISNKTAAFSWTAIADGFSHTVLSHCRSKAAHGPILTSFIDNFVSTFMTAQMGEKLLSLTGLFCFFLYVTQLFRSGVGFSGKIGCRSCNRWWCIILVGLVPPTVELILNRILPKPSMMEHP